MPDDGLRNRQTPSCCAAPRPRDAGAQVATADAGQAHECWTHMSIRGFAATAGAINADGHVCATADIKDDRYASPTAVDQWRRRGVPNGGRAAANDRNRVRRSAVAERVPEQVVEQVVERVVERVADRVVERVAYTFRLDASHPRGLTA